MLIPVANRGESRDSGSKETTAGRKAGRTPPSGRRKFRRGLSHVSQFAPRAVARTCYILAFLRRAASSGRDERWKSARPTVNGARGGCARHSILTSGYNLRRCQRTRIAARARGLTDTNNKRTAPLSVCLVSERLSLFISRQRVLSLSLDFELRKGVRE